MDGELLKLSKLEFHVYEEWDDYNDVCQFQELSQADTKGSIRVLYRVYSLNECPEDAIIGRSLVSAEEIIDFIKYGMRLNEQGYTADDIIVTYTPEDEDI